MSDCASTSPSFVCGRAALVVTGTSRTLSTAPESRSSRRAASARMPATRGFVPCQPEPGGLLGGGSVVGGGAGSGGGGVPGSGDGGGGVPGSGDGGGGNGSPVPPPEPSPDTGGLAPSPTGAPGPTDVSLGCSSAPRSGAPMRGRPQRSTAGAPSLSPASMPGLPGASL